jgi:AcrR family transcriptional regulator
MARLPVARRPAAPSSGAQQERYQRILDAAVKLGSEVDLEHVQMQDVATEADVAIATLYRYFPSKAHLFTGVMKAQIQRFGEDVFEARPDSSPPEVVADLLLGLTRRLRENQRLSMSMVQSIILAESHASPDSYDIETGFVDLLLRVAGWDGEATADRRSRVWLVIQCWFGVLMTTMSGNRPAANAEADLRRACELLLG